MAVFPLAGTQVPAGGAELETGSGPRRRATGEYCFGVRHTGFQSGADASLRNPRRSGSCSISDAITAGSILTCWLVVTVAWLCHSFGLRDRDSVVSSTSR
jgi:hypothetical protein